jgi:Protein of unknown function with PCYCGC motif
MQIRILPLKPYWIMLGIALLIVSACASPTGSGVGWPDYVLNAPPAVKEAYQFAVQHPDELAKYPCFCGCGKMGHKSNLNCYVKDIASNGAVTFDNHAAGCGICVDITRDVMRLRNEGKKSPQIRAYIDAQYGSFGPSTNTPLPLE